MATVLCDFSQIIGDSVMNIPVTTGGAEFPLPRFNTGGRISTAAALLVYSASGLTGTARVFINGSDVGAITPTASGVFSTQLIAVSGNQLRDGDNSIVLKSVSDAFTIKNLVCFFHQSD